MNKRGRLLLVVFVGLFILLVGGGLLMLGLKSVFGVMEENSGLKRRLADLRTVVQDGGRWEERSAWVEATLPRFSTAEEASTRLLEVVQTEADKAKLTITSKELLLVPKAADTAKTEGFFDKVSVRLTFNTVAEETLFAWMHAIQAPEHFTGVTRLQLAPSVDGRAVTAEIQVTQFYRETAARKVATAP